MSVKILGGFARGQLLAVPKGDLIRPTSVMLRRRIYDFVQTLEGVTFVDLCAGSGAMGFEAWSRNAKRVYLNEVNRHVLKSLEENRENLLLKNHHKKTGDIYCSNFPAEKWIKTFRVEYEKFTQTEKEETVIFLDPPYSEKNIYIDIIKYLQGESWYFGQLWVESDPLKGLSQGALVELGLGPHKVYEQGDSYIFVTNFPLN
ncbi:MAG: RsmD family RNA methyltransferase [Bdellovibrionales bacterium]|nr:RsmD family RNA methyltransferase [Bdellovibrionales bacterium]